MNSKCDSVDIFQYKDYFYKLWHGNKPLCLLFSTDKNDYLYDTGTNNILRCDRDEFTLLKCLFALNSENDNFLSEIISLLPNPRAQKAIQSLESEINTVNILKTTEIDSFTLPDEKEYVAHQIMNNLSLITLELTQECNLRCGYCIYRHEFDQRRDHYNIHMDEEIIKQSVRYLNEHSNDRKDVAIGFYGGEPFLRFSQIRKAVNYARQTIKNKDIRFSITTNGTLINKTIAEYIVKEEISVLLSIDGPKEIHDSWRKDIQNTGSFKESFRGLELLCNAHKKDIFPVGLSMVYAPPFSEEKIEKIACFIDSIEWLPKNLQINITYPHTSSFRGEIKNKKYKDVDYSLSNWVRKRFIMDYKMGKKSHPIANGIMERKFAHLLKRPISLNPINKIHLNGCCIPGARKNYICANGAIKICERIGLAPDIGTVMHGIDLNVINKYYIDDYAKNSLEKCSQCWLIRLCPICYEHVYYNNKIDLNEKAEACFFAKMGMKSSLTDLCALIEYKEKGLDYLKEWEIS